MARPLRIYFEDAYYHLTCRGNSRQEIFADDLHRKAFLDLLGRSREIYQIEVLAYVLMANHQGRIIEVLCKVIGVGREELMQKGRKAKGQGVLMKMLYEYGGMKQREIGGLMGMDYSSVPPRPHTFPSPIPDFNLSRKVDFFWLKSDNSPLEA